MTLRSLTLSALLLLVAALPVRADDIAALTDLAKRASGTNRPAATFLNDLDSLSDGTEIDRAEVAAATANVQDGVVADLLRGVTSIRKVGNLVTIERTEVKTIPFGDKTLKFDRRVRLAFDKGELQTLRPADRARLRQADPAKGYTRLRPISGVTLDSAPVRTIVAVEEDGKPVTHMATGFSGDVSWTRLDGPQAPIATDQAAQQGVEVTEAIDDADGIMGQLDENVTRPIAEANQTAQLPATDLPGLGEPQLEAGDLQDLLADEREGLLDAPQAEAQEPAAAVDGGLANGPQISDEATAIADTPEVVVPPAEEQAKIDADVDDLADEFQSLTDELKALKDLWQEDRERAQSALEAQLEALRADNARLEAQLAELKNDSETPIKVEGPDVAKNEDLSGPNLNDAEPLKKPSADEADGAKDEGKKDEEMKPLERMLMALLEGITKILQEKLVSAATTNLETRAAIVANNTQPVYQPYADARLNNTLGPVVTGPQWNGNLRTRVLRITPGAAVFAQPNYGPAPAAAPAPNTAPTTTPITPAPTSTVRPIPVGGPKIN